MFQEALAPGDCIPNQSGSSLTSLTNALFTHIFPQFSMPEHKYVLDLITMGQSLCKPFLKQKVPTKQQCAIIELNLLQDALPSMVLLNCCTTHIDGDPNYPQLKLNTNGKSLNAVLDTAAKVSLINKQLFDQIPHKCKTALRPSILQLVAANMSEIDNAGVSDITFQLGNTTFTHKFVVSNSLGKEILLGIDFGYGNQIKLLYHDDHSQYLEFGEDDHIDLAEKYPINFVVKAADNTKLPPYHFTIIKCCISQCAKTMYHADDILHITPTAKYSNKMDAPLLQNSTVSYHASGKVFLIMANHTPTYHTIKTHNHWH